MNVYLSYIWHKYDAKRLIGVYAKEEDAHTARRKAIKEEIKEELFIYECKNIEDRKSVAKKSMEYIMTSVIKFDVL